MNYLYTVTIDTHYKSYFKMNQWNKDVQTWLGEGGGRVSGESQQMGGEIEGVCDSFF